MHQWAQRGVCSLIRVKMTQLLLVVLFSWDTECFNICCIVNIWINSQDFIEWTDYSCWGGSSNYQKTLKFSLELYAEARGRGLMSYQLLVKSNLTAIERLCRVLPRPSPLTTRWCLDNWRPWRFWKPAMASPLTSSVPSLAQWRRWFGPWWFLKALQAFTFFACSWLSHCKTWFLS